MRENILRAVEKMKEIDGLHKIVKENSSNITKLSVRQTELRKKSGNEETVVKINDQKSELERQIKEYKAKIKSLRNEVCDVFATEYVSCDDITKGKIAKAVKHVTEGKFEIVVPSSSTDLYGVEIVETVKTQVLENKGKIERVIKAGIKNVGGRVLYKPQVAVYLYAEDAVEGFRQKVENFVFQEDKPKKEQRAEKPAIKLELTVFSPLFILLGVLAGFALVEANKYDGVLRVLSATGFFLTTLVAFFGAVKLLKNVKLYEKFSCGAFAVCSVFFSIALFGAKTVLELAVFLGIGLICALIYIYSATRGKK